MRIAILGTRGIPNHYGGFEQCAEYLAKELVEKGHQVIVYNSHNHPYQQSHWKGVELVHIYDPEFKLGTVGQFIYDFNCIRDVRHRACDIILQLGYTSSSVWGALLPKNVVVTTNMDGLEWKRTKFSPRVRQFLEFAEKSAVRYSDYMISDSKGIQTYLHDKYGKESTYIPYGAEAFEDPDAVILDDYYLTPYNYDLLIARLEPENSIEMILDGVVMADQYKPFLVIGNHNTKFGEYLKTKYKDVQNIMFLGGIYNINKLNNLRYYSNLYFHGHTVGGTNPSLLEAMASSALLSANDNPFNRYILGNDAFYFSSAEQVCHQMKTVKKLSPQYDDHISSNMQKIKNIYTWQQITDQYEAHFKSIKGMATRTGAVKKSKDIFDYALRLFF